DQSPRARSAVRSWSRRRAIGASRTRTTPTPRSRSSTRSPTPTATARTRSARSARSGSSASTRPPVSTACRTTSSSRVCTRPASSSTASRSPTSRCPIRRRSPPSPSRPRPRSRPLPAAPPRQPEARGSNRQSRVTRSSQSRGGGGGSHNNQLFRRQAEHFAMLGSPVYGHLAGRLAEDPRPARAILGDGATWDLGLRLFGAVHYLVLTGVAPSALSGECEDFLGALAAHEAALERFVREQGVQTNETQRCVALVPAFLAVARAAGLPLDLIELGPSAVVNLVFDRYGYGYAEGTFGASDARLR